MPIASINPATGETVKIFTPATREEVDAAIARAYERFADYRHTSYGQRARWANATADLLEAEADQTAAVMTLEMGKTLASAKAEVLKCAKGFRYYAENTEALLADEPIDAAKVGAARAYTRYQPLGVVLAVMPWNFPLWQAVRFAAPALMAGNVGLLKHASNVPQCALYLADVIARGGFPDGCFQTLLVPSSAVEDILRDPRVAAATLTGSEPAGQSVGAIAGDEIKPTVLELGGSDPFIVMPSADLDEAVKTAVTARVQNNGQSCIAAKRFIAHTDIYDAFVDKFVERMAALRIGDPTDPDTDVGPLATESGRDEIAKQVDDAAAAGAVIRCGGKAPERPGWFYPPTVITDITKDMALYTEEVFGPVASVYRAADIDEAIEIANATTFGLGSNAWTRDNAEQQRFVDEIEAGQVFINGMTVSYPELPFGGIKRSGYGRELSGHGIREFCNAKAVWVG
ncbi:MAG: NADP-dependent succinic semialdehyde dehydrogenase [Mycobacterium pseudokansasii]|uniref:Succinate-semialdehyde dehydrogenase [NADP(+)] 1 n=1 Tax=Mycobacterium pseudokansasii TaxID=2341080 RepID=A0A498QGZ6_9MYCO|nr:MULTISPECIES: NADP-dependent succinic semialdehyde dehydrogenase [Mycobacterium]KZS66446.1 succinate-semialdehyde dehydrogenase [Mycobacterium kansasii]MBY0391000.1 NADP-dependent succinic semialdehyde dehydrogenase [Mycobacterium pseudokansasii]ORC12085.1 NADP-dependent succinic semialdehyde dehydrogenase [Mycobacterium kansasii]POX96810.1 NADP-dependent succinic semialdehyde dehydrogenase [Mycobacterium kansasii]VAZ71137.1 Succinate-semialdehyde dehydrogenase [NADP(+)] 1 [Mycobacterium ka